MIPSQTGSFIGHTGVTARRLTLKLCGRMPTKPPGRLSARPTARPVDEFIWSPSAGGSNLTR